MFSRAVGTILGVVIEKRGKKITIIIIDKKIQKKTFFLHFEFGEIFLAQ